MDSDLKPGGVQRPSTDDITKPSVPTSDGSDPFKPDAEPPAIPNVPKPMKKRGGGKKILMLLLVLLLIGAAGYGVYYWQQKHVKSLISERIQLNKQIADLQAQAAASKAAADKATATPAKPTTDELVITAVKDYCQAAVDPTTKKALVVTENSTKKVMYSTSDKNYATTQAACAATAGSTDMKTYYLKYSGTTWVVLYAAAAPDATQTKTYAVPADFK